MIYLHNKCTEKYSHGRHRIIITSYEYNTLAKVAYSFSYIIMHELLQDRKVIRASQIHGSAMLL
jgi:hypothetical protein